jgi:hypothetical protein
MSSFSPSAPPSRAPQEDWQATRQDAADPKTQVQRDKEDYLANAARDVGRLVGAGQWELFVVSSPESAMQMQFEHLQPEYIAIHDIGTSSSRRLLAGLAAASQGIVQKLVIRRQGYGVALATLEFVELPVTGGPPLRLYTTEVDADTHSRHELAHVLLGHSRLGVVMVGDLPPHALPGALLPLSDAIAANSWPNRQLLVLPLSTGSALAAQAAKLGVGRGIEVRTTPQVTRPAEAWSFISGSWNRMREQLVSSGVTLPLIGASATPSRRATDAPPDPLPMQPMPDVPKAGARPQAHTPLMAYVQQCAELKGVVSCCAFEVATQKPIAHAGARPGPAVLAAQGAALYATLVDTGRQLGLGPSQPDAAVTLASHHLLLRAIPGQQGIALHVVLDRSGTNLTLVRLQLQRLDETLLPRP